MLVGWQTVPAADHSRAILVVGDSLSAGYGIDQQDSWVSLLRDRLQAEGYGYRVVNASISGDTTTSGLKRLPRALELHRPAIAVIELGGNDGLRATPIPVIRGNLARMIGLSRKAGAQVLLLGMRIPENYGGPYTRAFANLYADLAREYRVSLVPFFLEGMALDRSLFQGDGIHPAAAAQAILLANVWPVLEPVLEHPARSAGAGTDREGAGPQPASPAIVR